MEKIEAQRPTLTVEEAAIALGVGRNTAYEAVRSGQIPSIKIGRRRLIPRAAFERLLAEGNTKFYTSVAA